jgi:hypothetical protein
MVLSLLVHSLLCFPFSHSFPFLSNCAEHIPNVQPPFTIDEYHVVERLVKTNEKVAAILTRRGVADLSKVMVSFGSKYECCPI